MEKTWPVEMMERFVEEAIANEKEISVWLGFNRSDVLIFEQVDGINGGTYYESCRKCSCEKCTEIREYY